MTGYRDENLEAACAGLLSLLPESDCRAEALAAACAHYGVSAAGVSRAAELLPEHYELQYRGVRLLLGEYLREALRPFGEADGRRVCEVSVPAPPQLVLELQSAARRAGARLQTGALAQQMLLRGLLLSRAPLDMTSCSKRRCGLNKMRGRLFLDQPGGSAPELLLEFGVLCDECAKTGEGLLPAGSRVCAVLPKRGAQGEREWLALVSAGAARAAVEAEERLGLRRTREDGKFAAGLYSRFLRAQAELLRLNARPGRRPLYGNSLALAQTVQLMVFDEPERAVDALELLCSELEAAPEAGEGRKRLYCFYVPFLQPELDRRFRENGVDLLGSAAFLYTNAVPGFGTGGAAAAWLAGMTVSGGVRREYAAIAEEMERSGCCAYFTGAFGFDRWMGAPDPLRRRILAEEHGVRTLRLDSDFWCENAMFGSTLERVDNLCVQL